MHHQSAVHCHFLRLFCNFLRVAKNISIYLSYCEVFNRHHHSEATAAVCCAFIFYDREKKRKSWVIMEWIKKILPSTKLLYQVTLKARKENEHKSAGNNLSISQNTRQAELFTSFRACWCKWKIVAHLTRIFHFLLLNDDSRRKILPKKLKKDN